MATNTEYYALIKPSLADVADIAAINQNTDKIDKIMHGSQTSIADAYDPAEVYNLRDKVMHDFQLYTCLVNGTTGTWDPTKWERTNAADSGGNYVDVTEKYQAGLNITDIDIDGDQHSIYVPEMTAATAQAPGTPGLVPPPTPADSGKYLDSSGNWSTPPGGGGGGTTVIPNPQGTPTDTLNTIQIGQTIFDIPGSGGGAGSGFKQDLLWDYTADNNGIIPYGTYSATLHDNINNYDMLAIESVSISGDLTSDWQSTNLWYVDVYALNNNWYNNYITYTSWNERATKFHIVNTTFEAVKDSGQDTNGLVRVYGVKFGGGSDSEIIPITGGDGTTSRTFTFPKTPKFIKFYYQDLTLDSGWLVDSSIVWGQAYATTLGHRVFVETANASGGCIALTYPTGDKSVTITAGNAFQACNTVNGTGFMYVDYGEASGSSQEISDMTWTELVSTTGTSTAVAIPQGTKKLVLTAQLGGIVTKVAEESMANIQKLLDVSLETTWNMGGEYADTAGNHTNVAMSVTNGLVTARSGYNTVTAKVYALS